VSPDTVLPEVELKISVSGAYEHAEFIKIPFIGKFYIIGGME
jgi:hypothetical protein